MNKLQEVDTANMTSVEMFARAQELIQQAQAQSMKEFESTMNFLSDKLAYMGKSKKDAVLHLIKMMKSAEEAATLAELASGARARGDLDSQGKLPEVGVEYKLPTGETWVRKSKMGPTKRMFADHAKTTTWDEMKA